jgi:hypothetical protein
LLRQVRCIAAFVLESAPIEISRKKLPEKGDLMTLPTNTYTVTFSDAHAHTLQFPAVPAAGGNIMSGKMDALRNVLLEAADNAGNLLSAFTATDTLTVTITQP